MPTEEILTAARIARLDLSRVADANTLQRGRRYYAGGRALSISRGWQPSLVQVYCSMSS